MAEKILIVDDDFDTVQLVGIMLQRQGYQTVAASNGSQALTMAQAENPDLIILDVMMPDMDGYLVTQRLRADPTTSAVPIILFTAKAQVEEQVSGFQVGFDDYLTKPTQPRELYAHVKTVLNRSAKTRLPSVPVASPPERGMVLGVLSAKAGLGNSTLAVNLGVVLYNQTKKEVVVAEFRPGEGSLALDLGYTQPEGLSHLLEFEPGQISLPAVERELVSHPAGIRLLMASYQPRDARLVNQTEAFETITKHLSYIADYLILDLGPAIHPAADKVLDHCDGVAVVLEPVPVTIRRTKALIEDLREKGFSEGAITLVLVNRVRTEHSLSWTQVQDLVSYPISVAFTPAPELVYQAAQKNSPVVVHQEDSLITQQFTKLADILTRKVRQKA